MSKEIVPPDGGKRDVAGVIFLPPLGYVVTLLAGMGIQSVWPVKLLPEGLASALGTLSLTAGGALCWWGERVLHRAGTNINPHKPTVAVVAEGPYRFTRNPLYVGMALLYLGLSLLMNALWPVVLLPLLLVVVDWGVVRREERYLASKFGQPYLDYKKRVRRWI